MRGLHNWPFGGHSVEEVGLTPLFGITHIYIYIGKGWYSRTTGCRIAKDSVNPVIELETRRHHYIWKTICRCYKSFSPLKSRRNAYRLFHSSVVTRSTLGLIAYRWRTQLNFLWVVRGVGFIRFEFLCRENARSLSSHKTSESENKETVTESTMQY